MYGGKMQTHTNTHGEREKWSKSGSFDSSKFEKTKPWNVVVKNNKDPFSDDEDANVDVWNHQSIISIQQISNVTKLLPCSILSIFKWKTNNESEYEAVSKQNHFHLNIET